MQQSRNLLNVVACTFNCALNLWDSLSKPKLLQGYCIHGLGIPCLDCHGKTSNIMIPSVLLLFELPYIGYYTWVMVQSIVCCIPYIKLRIIHYGLLTCHATCSSITVFECVHQISKCQVRLLINR